MFYLDGGIEVMRSGILTVASQSGVHLGVHHLDGGHGLEQPKHVMMEQLTEG